MSATQAATGVAVPQYLVTLAPIVTDVVAPEAAELDQSGVYPRAALDALGEAGLLGLISAPEVGGIGEGHRAATAVVEELAKHCASTAMVVLMHYAATAVIEAYGPTAVREEIAAGRFVATLAFSEVGSRSQFWAPLSTATAENGHVRLDAEKSWVTSAGQATGYVWSSRPLAGKGPSGPTERGGQGPSGPTERGGQGPSGPTERGGQGPSTLWLVPNDIDGLSVGPPFDGLGLRGNYSSPMTAKSVSVPSDAMLGPDGGGFDVMVTTVLPYFQLMSAGFSVGLMEAATTKAAAHAASTRLEHLDQSLADNPVVRANVARMRVATDQARALVRDALSALETGRLDAMLLILESKVAASEAAAAVTDLAMRVCGGAAYRKEVGVERHFRDARASSVMAPTSDALYEFVGRLACGLPLF